jgi:hypothetical protein
MSSTSRRLARRLNSRVSAARQAPNSAGRPRRSRDVGLLSGMRPPRAALSLQNLPEYSTPTRRGKDSAPERDLRALSADDLAETQDDLAHEVAGLHLLERFGVLFERYDTIDYRAQAMAHDELVHPHEIGA